MAGPVTQASACVPTEGARFAIRGRALQPCRKAAQERRVLAPEERRVAQVSRLLLAHSRTDAEGAPGSVFLNLGLAVVLPSLVDTHPNRPAPAGVGGRVSRLLLAHSRTDAEGAPGSVFEPGSCVCPFFPSSSVALMS
jgi:hypothetical protein